MVSFADDGNHLRRARGAAAAADRAPAHGLFREALHGRGVEDVRDEARAPSRSRVGGDAGGVVRIGLGEREFTPPEISAFILRELKHRAEALLRASKASSTSKSIAR